MRWGLYFIVLGISLAILVLIPKLVMAYWPAPSPPLEQDIWIDVAAPAGACITRGPLPPEMTPQQKPYGHPGRIA